MYHARRWEFTPGAPVLAALEDTLMTPSVDPSGSSVVPTLVLDPDRIVDTIRTLRNRIEERFPGSGLGQLCSSLHEIGEHTKTRLDRVERPNEELGGYLDYCSELLSLTSKLAALYAERFSDSVVLQAVDEVETLTTGLSRKIWQKIMMLDARVGEA